jgi:hypothetical protein
LYFHPHLIGCHISNYDDSKALKKRDDRSFIELRDHGHCCDTSPTKAAPLSPSVGVSTRTHSTLLTLSLSLRVKGLTRGWYGWWTKAYKVAPPCSTSNLALNTRTSAHGPLMGHPNWAGCDNCFIITKCNENTLKH